VCSAHRHVPGCALLQAGLGRTGPAGTAAPGVAACHNAAHCLLLFGRGSCSLPGCICRGARTRRTALLPRRRHMLAHDDTRYALAATWQRRSARHCMSVVKLRGAVVASTRSRVLAAVRRVHAGAPLLALLSRTQFVPHRQCFITSHGMHGRLEVNLRVARRRTVSGASLYLLRLARRTATVS
jgi:hypothetical protein